MIHTYISESLYRLFRFSIFFSSFLYISLLSCLSISFFISPAILQFVFLKMSLPITSRVIKLMPLTYRSVLSRPSIPSRHLHMTGPTTFPSTLLANRIPGIASEYLTKDHFSLKADAQGRGLDTRGNRNDVSTTSILLSA